MSEGVDSGLRALVDAVGELSAGFYTLDGRRFEVAEPEAPPADTGAAAGGEHAALTASLAKDLYDSCYSGRGSAATGRTDYLVRRRHLARLSEANRGRGTWEAGWRVRAVEPDGAVAVAKDNVTFWTAPEGVRCRGGEAAAGESCRVRIPAELIESQPGFYVALGDADRAAGDVAAVVRLYWHLRAASSARWVRVLTTALNHRRVPFRLKTLIHPRYFRRTDAGVLYLDPEAAAAARDAIVDTYRQVGGGLRPEVPALTRRLAPGLALAEGPADGSSFGEHRCRLIAAALVRTFEQGRGGFDDRLRAVAEAFRDAGLDPSRPYLAAGSSGLAPALADLAAELGEGAGPRNAATRAGARDRRDRGDPSLAAAAHRLGDRLCETAIWYQDRCNWIGRSQDELDLHSGTFTPTAAALDASLYRGAAGVGLFLAELYRRTEEECHRRTAAGALRRALAPPADAEEAPPAGFFDGRLGVAWVARNVAALIDDRDLKGRADSWLAVVDDPADEHSLDVYGGNAGAILAWLGLHRASGEAGFLAAAVALGEEIVAAADRDGETWSWSNRRLSGIDAQPMLTGFSHGAAGVGLALLELFAATGASSFLAAATGAFAYEDALFDPAAGNWPDYRTGPRADRRQVTAAGPVFMTAWCHGAPGIALSRLRALEIDPERAASYAATARAGLGTTVEYLGERLAEPDADASLCHGICGLVDVLLIAADVLAEPEYRRRAEDAMRRLVTRHGESGEWPSGVPSRGSNPSLMLGEAGVGYTLLRCLDPERLPSVLVSGSMIL